MMENLMDFNSPIKFETLNENETTSPGSNPFDSALKTAETFSNNIGNEFFLSPNMDIDCGRESLGILHIDLENLNLDDGQWLNVPDIHVSSHSCQNSQVNSLSQLNTAFLYSHNKSNKLSAASTISPLLSYADSLDLLEVSRIPHQSSLLNSNYNSLSTLNRAFINSDSDNKTNRSDILLIKDKIYEIRPRIPSLPNMFFNEETDISLQNNKYSNHIENESLNMVDKAIYSNRPLKCFRKSESLFKKSFGLQNLLLKFNTDEDNEFNDSVFIEGKQFAAKFADGSLLETAEGELCNLDCTPQPDLVDISMSIEEEKVATSTEEIFKTVDKMIPSMSISPKIRKSADRLHDVEEKDCHTPEHSEQSIEYCNSCSSLNRNEYQNVSDIFPTDGVNKLSTSRLSQGSSNSKSRDAKSILHNLSEILNTDNPSVQQKCEGQNLLLTLADILCSNDTKQSENERDHSEDSGNSSIDQEIPFNNESNTENCNVMDLRVKTETSTENTDKPLDLSLSKMKKENITNKIVSTPVNSEISSKKINQTSRGNISTNRNKSDSINTNDRRISNVKANMSELSSFGKLKPKKVDKKVLPERGPLKAMIPVGNMSKVKGSSRLSKIGTTPPKSSQYGLCKTKRTSTPKTETNLQPVAQSTPEGNASDTRKFTLSSNHVRQRKLDRTGSPLARTNSICNDSTEELNKKNRSGSAPNLSSSVASNINSSQSMFRRRSASDLKLSKNPGSLKRSNTIDKDSGIATTLNRVRESIEKARNSALTAAKTSSNTKPIQYKAVLGERNRYSTPSGIKPCNLANKMKRSINKENVN